MNNLWDNKKQSALRKLQKEIRSGFYSYMILSILEEKKELHGYGIRKNLEHLSKGEIVPSEGALYDLLKSLKKYGLVDDFWAEIGGRQRRYYMLTDLGKEVLAELKIEVQKLVRIIERASQLKDSSNFDKE